LIYTYPFKAASAIDENTANIPTVKTRDFISDGVDSVTNKLIYDLLLSQALCHWSN